MTTTTILFFILLVRWLYVEIMYREAVKAITELTEWTTRNQRRGRVGQ